MVQFAPIALPLQERGQKLIPFAVQNRRRLRTLGKYPNPGKYPRGAVVHFTAGAFALGLQNAINDMNATPYTFMCIARTGELVQGHPVDEWGYHAGESAWKNVAKKFVLAGQVSDDLIGIEMNNAGRLEKLADGRFKTWFGTYVPKEQVRYVEQKDWGCPTGYYQKYSVEQEATLIRTLLWLKANDPTGETFNFEDCLGHHEVAGAFGIGYFRKNDPGGALSMPMPVFRQLLMDKWAAALKEGVIK